MASPDFGKGLWSAKSPSSGEAKLDGLFGSPEREQLDILPPIPSKSEKLLTESNSNC